MLTLFTVLTAFIKIRPDKTLIDNLGFKFHYRHTFLLLMVCTILSTSRWITVPEIQMCYFFFLKKFFFFLLKITKTVHWWSHQMHHGWKDSYESDRNLLFLLVNVYRCKCLRLSQWCQFGTLNIFSHELFSGKASQRNIDETAGNTLSRRGSSSKRRYYYLSHLLSMG